MSRTTHHVPWRRRTSACPHTGDDFRRYALCCAARTEHSITTLRRPRGAVRGDVAAVQEVTTAFAAYSYDRAFGGSKAAGDFRRITRRKARAAELRSARDLTGLANAALRGGAAADVDELGEDLEFDDRLDDLDGWVLPPRRWLW